MSSQKVNARTIVLVLMIVAATAFRLLSYEFKFLSNFTPVGAIALFGGAYFSDKWKAYVAVLLSLFLSDILINYLYTSKLVLWYGDSAWVYLTFVIMIFIGTLIKKVNVANVAIASLVSVCIHWLMIDMPWLYGSLYPHTFAGYGQSLIAAIPFERNMLLGDILFCSLLFGGFEFAKNRYTILRTNKELAI